MVSMFALATLLPLTTLAAHRQAGSASTVANRLEIIAYVFPRDRVLGPNEVAAKKLTRINYAFANVADGKVIEGFAHDKENFAHPEGTETAEPRPQSPRLCGRLDLVQKLLRRRIDKEEP
jgi:chitinase